MGATEGRGNVSASVQGADEEVMILAILQNQWFKEPERVAKMYAREPTPERRAALNRAFLFYKSLTGRRIKAAFGDELCRKIVWEEASKKVAGKSDGVFPADLEHIAAMINHFKPSVVLTFGKVAADGLLKTMPILTHEFEIIGGPHPAARHATVMTELHEMAKRLASRNKSGMDGAKYE
jgi:hypothetical protein